MTTSKNIDPISHPSLSSLDSTLGAQNPLSEREMEVAELLATGASNAEIARKLVISPHTVKVHLRNVFEKLQVNSRTEASMVLVQRGWLLVPGVEVPPIEVAAPPPPPDPEPLTDLPATLYPWQRVYLIGALLLCLFGLLAPRLRASNRNSPGLLSDAGRSVLVKPLFQDEPRWEVQTPLGKARSRLAVAAVDNGLYAIGGEAADGLAVANVDIYDLSVNQWHAASPLPEALANLAATALQGRIYVAGGSYNGDQSRTSTTLTNTVSNGVSDGFWVYDPAQDQWQRLGQLPTPLAGASLVADSEALYLLGGWDGQMMRDEIWRLVPPAREEPAPETAPVLAWEMVSRMETARAFLGAVMVQNEIYVIGGYDGRRELDLADVYATTTNEWRRLPPLSTPRGGLSVVYDGLAIFALGGGWTHPLDTLERFDPIANLWSNFASPLPGEWRHLAAISYNDRIHLFGGWGGDYLNNHLVYQSSFRSLLPVISND